MSRATPAPVTVPTALQFLRRERDLMLEAIGDADPRDRVVTAPDWRLVDLVAHVSGVHRWATAVVRDGRTENLTDDELTPSFAGPGRRGSAALQDWFATGVDQLATALEQAPDDLPAFTFLADPPAPRLFWARRQLHETTIHRVDALTARLGRLASTHEADIDIAVAADGIDELVTGFVPRRRSRLRSDETFRFVIAPTDVDLAWTVTVSEQPPVVVREAAPDATAVISGTAAGVYLGLWNRGDDIAETGSEDALGLWRETVRISWV